MYTFQSGTGPAEGDEPTGAPMEPEASGRRTSMEQPTGSETTTAGMTEGQTDADSLSAVDVTEMEGATSQEKESAKYIEKRGQVLRDLFINRFWPLCTTAVQGPRPKSTSCRNFS